MPRSGIECGPEAIAVLKDMKKEKNYKYMVLKIENKMKLVVDVKVEDTTFEPEKYDKMFFDEMKIVANLNRDL